MFASKLASLSLLLLPFFLFAQATIIPAHHRRQGVESAGSSIVGSVTAAVATATSTASSSLTTLTGDGTFYYQENTASACGETYQDTDKVAAIEESIFDASNCGKTIVVTNTATGATTNLIYADKCPGCYANSLDFSVAGFEAVAELATGRISISWYISA